MKRWLSFVIAAVVTFVLTLAGTAGARYFVNGTPAGSCRANYGLPGVGMFGEFYTLSESEPSGNQYFADLSCYYQDHVADHVTGAFVPPIELVTVTAYDGDDRWDPWETHRFDVRAALCALDSYQSIWWCSPSSNATNWTGWQNIMFHGPTGYQDMPWFWNERGWADPLGGFSKILYVYMPQNSTFTNWMVYNSTGD